MTTAWVVRAGKLGEREAWALDNGYAGTGWYEFPDLTPYASKDALAGLVVTSIPQVKEGAVANYSGQLWALRSRIQVGDLMVLPTKTTKQLAIGRVTGRYEYRKDEPDAHLRHVIPVRWERTDIPRSAVKQDLLFILGSALTVFAPSRNHAVERLQSLLTSGTDPGQVPSLTPPGPLGGTSVVSDEAVDEPELVPDIEDQAQSQIQARIAEEFAGHSLSDLVTALLEIEGFVCHTSPPGADGGVDIMAGRGPLGLDSPLLLVQVKSGHQVGSQVMQQLHGAMNQYGADQGLLVSWGGLSKAGQSQMQNARMRVKLWQAPDIIDAVLASYGQLPANITRKLPLKQVWLLSDAGS